MGADSGDRRPPASPALPVFAPCPLGWRTVVDPDLGFELCHPYAESGRAACIGPEAHLPGAPGCRPVGGPCPVGEFADDLPAGADIVYVRVGATGTGTRADPFGTVAEAIAAAPDGAIVAIATGTYDEPSLLIDRSMTLWGACFDTVLRFGDAEIGISANGPRVTLRRLQLQDVRRAVTTRGADLLVDGLYLLAPAQEGFVVFSSNVEIRDTLVRGARDGAINLIAAESVVVEASAIVDTEQSALTTSAGTLTIRDSLIADGGYGMSAGITFASGEAAIIVERSVFADNGSELFINLDGASLDMSDSVVFGAEDFEAANTALNAFLGGSLSLSRVRIERPHDIGIAIADPGSTFHATDLLVRESASVDGSGDAHGIEVALSATATLERVYVERAGAIGVLIHGSGARIDAADLTIRGTQSNTAGLMGRAVQVQLGGILSAERVDVSANHEVAVVSAGAGSDVILREAVVRTTAPRGCADTTGCPPAGIGIGAYELGHVDVTRFSIADNDLVGLQLAAGGSADLSDGEVRGHVVGVNVPDPGYDLSRLTRDVYYDNVSNLDSSELPIPDVTVPFSP